MRILVIRWLSLAVALFVALSSPRADTGTEESVCGDIGGPAPIALNLVSIDLATVRLSASMRYPLRSAVHAALEVRTFSASIDTATLLPIEIHPEGATEIDIPVSILDLTAAGWVRCRIVADQFEGSLESSDITFDIQLGGRAPALVLQPQSRPETEETGTVTLLRKRSNSTDWRPSNGPEGEPQWVVASLPSSRSFPHRRSARTSSFA